MIIYVLGSAFRGSRTVGEGSSGLEIDAGEKPLLYSLLSNPCGEFAAVYGPTFMMNVWWVKRSDEHLGSKKWIPSHAGRVWPTPERMCCSKAPGTLSPHWPSSLPYEHEPPRREKYLWGTPRATASQISGRSLELFPPQFTHLWDEGLSNTPWPPSDCLLW